MAIADEKVKNNINPIILVEIDIGQEQEFFTTYAAGTWYVNFNRIYAEIIEDFLNGVEAQDDITSVGSVIVDNIRM